MKLYKIISAFSLIATFFLQPILASNNFINDTAYVRTFGGVNSEEFKDIVQTPDSGFMMAGITDGYGQGSNAVYVVKASKDGTHVWSKALGGVSADLAYAIGTDNNGNYFIAGTSSSGGNGGYDGYLICLDISGNILWEKYYGGTDWDFINALAVMPDQSILLAGESYSFSDGGSDAWVLHLNNSGDTTWTRHFGESGNDAFKNINLTSTAIYLSGYVDSTDANGKDGYFVKLDPDGNEIFKQRHNNLGRDILNGSITDQSGDMILYGATAPFDSTKNDLWLEKTDTNGVTKWIANSIDPEDDYALDMIPISNNELFLIGQKDPSGNGGKSIFMGRYDMWGFQIAAQSFGGPQDEEAYGLIRTIQGGVAFVGYTTSYGVGNKDALLVYLNADSSLTAAVTYSTILFTETLSPISVEDISSQKNILVFPNPASDQLFIRSDNNEEIVSVSVYNYAGAKIKFLQNDQFDHSLEIPLQKISGGTYLIKIQLKNGKEYLSKVCIIK